MVNAQTKLYIGSYTSACKRVVYIQNVDKSNRHDVRVFSCLQKKYPAVSGQPVFGGIKVKE